ncbi:MAG: FAD-dependent tricarballylate dehydrogenase TcuA [Sphaerobacter sp.]|nr:FAD-dependent tricarballylate dehydrogenase TcuA [Sphaerobacter sp.]
MQASYDVVIAGTGNAAFCAAHAARERGARVLMLEKAPEAWIGGNSYFTAGAYRVAFDSLDELVALLADPSDERLARTDVPPYPAADFLADLERVTEGRTDPVLAGVLVHDSLDTMRWLRDHGIRFQLQYDRQSFEIDGRFQFWGNLPLGTVGGGVGLIAQHRAAAEAQGVEIRFETPVVWLLRDATGAVVGVVVDGPRGREEIRAGAVVLACGGFEADVRLRTMYLGSGWDVARVRGTPYNTGEGLHLALEAGAEPYGHWSGCHSIQWDAGAPPFGDRTITNHFSKQSYPIGIIVNAHGQRFLDEGADFRNYTYARYGAEILKQPGAIAWQLFDAKTTPLLRQDEYTAPGVSRIEADTIHALAVALGIDPAALEKTVADFNAAVQPGPFNPAIKDGKRIMEHATNVAVVPASFGWTDLGDWHSLADLLAPQQDANVAIGTEHLAEDTQRTLVFGNGRAVATLGVEDLIIVDTDDVLLVCHRSRAQDVRRIVQRLRDRGQDHLC